MDYVDSLESLIITGCILWLIVMLLFIGICINLKIYSRCYNDSSKEFYNSHEKLCKLYEGY